MGRKLVKAYVGHQYRIKADGWSHKKGSITTITRIEIKDMRGTDETRIWISLPNGDEKFVTREQFNTDNIEAIEPEVTVEEIEEAKNGLEEILGIK